MGRVNSLRDATERTRYQLNRCATRHHLVLSRNNYERGARSRTSARRRFQEVRENRLKRTARLPLGKRITRSKRVKRSFDDLARSRVDASRKRRLNFAVLCRLRSSSTRAKSGHSRERVQDARGNTQIMSRSSSRKRVIILRKLRASHRRRVRRRAAHRTALIR